MKIYLFFILILILISCSKDKKEEESEAEKIFEVQIGQPVKMKLIEYLDLNATTTFLRQEIVKATFQGYIEKNYKNIGDEVNPGDVLFVIKTKEAAATDSININLEYGKFSGLITIKSKTKGVLSELNHQSGDYVTESDQLALIVDPGSLKIILNVPFQNIDKININSIYPLRLPDGKTIEAKAVKKIPSIDPVNQTQSFILEVLNDKNLPSNLNVIVRLPSKIINDAIVLPKSSVMANEMLTEFWVMKLINDSTAIKIDIKKGIETDSLVQITKPLLNIEDKLIFEGAYGLPDTANVSILKNEE